MKTLNLIFILVLILFSCKDKTNENASAEKENTTKTEQSSQNHNKKKSQNSKVEIPITPIQHASFMMKLDGKTIFFDPVGGGEEYQKMGKPDLIFITHTHGDHFDLSTLKLIMGKKTRLIVPQSVYDELPENFQEHSIVMANHERETISGIKVMAFPMYNLPPKEDAFHPKGKGNGYILSAGGKNIYVSGDTEDIPMMRSLKKIDIAFICMNLPYTMSVKQAAGAVLEMKPKTVYPYHFRGKEKMSDVRLFKEIINKRNPDINVKILQWYPNQDERLSEVYPEK